MSQRNAIIEYLGEDWTRTEALIVSSLASDIALLNDTNDSILSHSGKKLRPILTLLMARACGGACTGDSIKFAAAVELLHNATLLHDDVADGSEIRRGAPTVASLLGDTPSVLVGDFWLVKAVEAVLSAEHRSPDIIKHFSCTLSNLAEGEMFQLEKASTGDTSVDDYMRIIYAKTASLFETACVSAAISVGAPEDIEAAARAYAINLGLAFQIKDDILDYEGEDIGKPVGMDIKEQKITMPLLGALSHASREEGTAVRRMVSHINEHPENVGRIVEFVRANHGIEYATARLHELCDKAIEALSVIPDGQAKEYLKDLAVFTADRNK